MDRNLGDGPLNTGILYIYEYGNAALQVPKMRGLAPCKLTQVTDNPVVVGTQNRSSSKGLPCSFVQ